MDTVTLNIEIVKIAASVLTPIALAYVGWLLQHAIFDLNKSEAVNSRLLEKRLEAFEVISPLLNRLLQFYIYVGDWKNISPCDVLETKGRLDSLVIAKAPLFSREFLISYSDFMKQLFLTYQGRGTRARILSAFESRKSGVQGWDLLWEDLFCPEQRVDRAMITQKYWSLMAQFAVDFGGGFSAEDGDFILQLPAAT